MWTSTAELNNAYIQNPLAVVYQSAWIAVLANDTNHCSAADSVFIRIKDCDETIYVPNAFTPNGDGVNDVLYVYGNCLEINQFRVFNRWGEKVWDTVNMDQGWDGYYKGVLQSVGVYVYLVRYSSNSTNRGIARELKGSVTLIR